MLIQKCKFCKI